MTAKLRVLSYNVHNQSDDGAALAAVVRGAAPDVVLVQEAPRRWRWRTKCAALARSFDMVVAGGGLPALGNLVLTGLRVRVHEVSCVRFPLVPGRHLRGAVLADCSVPGARFTIAGSHLSLYPEERVAQAALLRGALAGAAGPVIVGGDLNEQSDGAAWRTLAEGLVDAAEVTGCGDRSTFPCRDPRRRIDALFVDPRVTVLGYDVIDTPESRRASDHFPILVDVELPAS